MCIFYYYFVIFNINMLLVCLWNFIVYDWTMDWFGINVDVDVDIYVVYVYVLCLKKLLLKPWHGTGLKKQSTDL
jgi:hypothetical protein